MTEQDIRLEYMPGSKHEVLVGLEDELIADDRIIAAVAAHGRLFPHVVIHLAVNQHKKENPDYVHQPDEPCNDEVRALMGGIRDELVDGLVARAEEQERQRKAMRLAQARNMTRNVRPDRAPYFVR